MKKNYTLNLYQFLLVSFFLFSVSPSEATTKSNLSKSEFSQLSNELKEMDTAHFKVIYKQKDRPIAQYAAYYAELAYEKLSKDFVETYPKITLIINLEKMGRPVSSSASTFPYPQINISTKINLPEYGLNLKANWMFNLLVHELTHIFSFKPAHGIYKPARLIFGSVISPHSLLPKWFIEGIAVYSESYYNGKGEGRLNSPMTWATLRAIDFDQESIDRINEVSIPSWPYGNRPYLLGSFLINKAAKNDIQSINKWVQTYSRKTIPYLALAEPIEQKGSPKTWKQLYKEAIKEIKEKISQQKKYINNSGVLKRIQLVDGLISKVKLSPDGKYLAVVDTTETPFGNKLKIYASESWKELIKTIPLVSSSHINWLPDSQGIVFTNPNLFIYNIKNAKIDQLTPAKKQIQYPSISPNGKKAIYVIQKSGYSELKTIDLKTKEKETVFNTKIGQRISFPYFLNSKKIIFTITTQNRNEHISKLDLGKKNPISILKKYKDVSYLFLDKKTLYFISSLSGVPNLYTSDSPFTETFSLTNTTTGVTTGVYNSFLKKVYFTELTKKGTQSFQIPLKKRFQLPVIKPLIQVNNKKTNPSIPVPKDTDLQKWSEQKYNPWPYLIPRYWIPKLFFIGDFTLFSANTTMSDPAQKHIYSIDTSINNIVRKWDYLLSYTNLLKLPFIVSHKKFNQFLNGQRFYTRSTTINVTLPSQKFFPNFSAKLGWTYESKFADNLNNNRGIDPIVPGPFKSIKKSGPQVTISYTGAPNSALRKNFSLLYSQYLKSGQRIAYNKILLSTELSWKAFGQSVKLTVKKFESSFKKYIFELGERNFNFKGANLLTRGYRPITFSSTNFYSANLEVRTNPFAIYRGNDLIPFFIKNLSFRFFGDAFTFKGPYYIKDKRIIDKKLKFYYSIGTEVSLATTLFYHLPINIIFGIHAGLDKEAFGEISPILTFEFPF